MQDRIDDEYLPKKRIDDEYTEVQIRVLSSYRLTSHSNNVY